jgi:hypothetical protein
MEEKTKTQSVLNQAMETPDLRRRIERTMISLIDADIEISNVNDLVVRGVDEYLLLREYRAKKQKSLIDSAKKSILGEEVEKKNPNY